MGQFLLALRIQIDALHIIHLFFWLIFILVNLQSLVKANQDIPGGGLEQDALGIGDALLVAQDAIVVFLPHVDIRWPNLLVNCLFSRHFCVSCLSEVVRLVLVINDLVHA